ncbi:hypothetical protein [Stenotrophomonas sp. B1-1]|uniref:hypothetical protein n=1 Tax=Stenotrophomonas sp. B1-1 TaxID=2710648 RepID=UPI0013DCA2C7|nr:hypothetical protein [Stenotrophomonas sp. B1-1]
MTRSIFHITADLVSAVGGIARLASPEALPARCLIVQRCYALATPFDSLTIGQLLQWSNEAIASAAQTAHTDNQERIP